jgi:pyridinium-3,5-bisthiocarboxylic acid mononucleotide nickel chelatase
MIVGALLHLGVPRTVVDTALAELSLPGVRVGIRSVFAGAIAATQFDVQVNGEQAERSYAEIRQLLNDTKLSPAVRELAQEVFRRLAEAEAEVHGISVQDVHFHEVGAADSIVDIVCAAACLEYLGAEVSCSTLPLGQGSVRCRHGVIPLPAPATVLCLRGMRTVDSGLDVELVTPTGAAILGTVCKTSGAWPSITPEQVGWGAGTRQLPDRPNALRVVLGERSEQTQASQRVSPTASHAVLECNVDDMNGELMGYVIEKLLAAGALDAWATPVTMKKGRPGWVLSALGTAQGAHDLGRVMLRESSSIGLRRSLVSRVELSRRSIDVVTPFGKIAVKVSGEPGSDTFHAKPEFEACRAAAEQHDVPLRQVIEAALHAVLAAFRTE